jgi:RNA polymerase sigma-70 factor (ECF subfamily)
LPRAPRRRRRARRPELALAEVDGLRPEDYHPFHATHADLLRRLGRSQESRAAYDRAIELADDTAETAYLIRRRDLREK